jgi:predicted permease
MYSFFALLNIKIYLSIGIISYFKKVYSQKSLINLSQLLVNAFLPIYGIIEVARMATPENMEIFWIMIISVILSMVIGFYASKFFQFFLKLDVRISSSFSLLCCLPSIGTLPLVLGRAFCFPGGPLEGDPQCSNILGYMMINYLVFQIGLFLIGFGLIAKDANYGYALDDKMGLTWHIIIEKIFKKNFFILHIFRKYFKDKKLANKAFENFEKNNKLIRNEGEITYKFVCFDKDEAITDSQKYNNEFKKNPQIMIPVMLNDLKEEPFGDYKIEKLEEPNDYLKKYVEAPPKVKKVDDNVYTDLRRNSSNRMIPKNKMTSDKFRNYSQLNQYNENKENDGKKQVYFRKSTINQIEHQNQNNNLYENGKSDVYIDSKGNFINEKDSIFSEKDKETELNNVDNKLNLENIVIKKQTGNQNAESLEFTNPTITKIATIEIDELINLEKKKLRKKSSINPSDNIGNLQSETLRLNTTNIQTDHSIHFQISKRDKFAKSLKILPDQQKEIHENLENFLVLIKENIILKPDHKHGHDFYLSRKSLKNIQVTKVDKLRKMREINNRIFKNRRITTTRMIKHISLFDTGISRYYQKMFRIIEGNINKNYLIEFQLEKSEIMKNLHDIPPKFPIARGIEVNRININEINAIWDDYILAIKKLNNEFELHTCLMKADLALIINKIHSPAVVGTILGLIIGISGMREVLFSSNHYITNLVEGILVLTRATVPFLYLSVGISFVTIRGFSLDLPVSKKHMLVGMIIRFIIVPGCGLLWTYLWTEFYGGIIKQSRVFRISLFIPFCVPSSANLVIITNLLKYFVAESNLLLVGQNITLLVTLTILYLIYFVVIGI